MSTFREWMENNLSPEVMKIYQREKENISLYAGIMGIACFWTGYIFYLAVSVGGKGNTTIIWCSIILAVTMGLLIYIALPWAFKQIPKRISYSSEGIRFITQDNKEKFIPWRHVWVIAPQPAWPGGQIVPDFFIMWGMAGTRLREYEVMDFPRCIPVSQKIGIKLVSVWQQYLARSGEK